TIYASPYLRFETSSLNKLIFGESVLSNSDFMVHKRQRRSLMPVFTAEHMREMVPIFTNVTQKLRNTIAKRVENGTQEIEILSWLSRTAFELIGQSGLGVSFDALDNEEGAHPYSATIKNIMPLISRVLLLARRFLPICNKIGTPDFRRWIARNSPWDDMRCGHYLSYYMWDLSTKIYEDRKRALEKGDQAVCEQLTKGKDILSVLMNSNVNADEKNKLEEKEILGQIAHICSCGYNFARTLDVLSTETEAQERLRQEINEARIKNYGEDFDYDTLLKLPYLDAVCKEVLRLYPPAHRLIRTSSEDSVVPLGTPVTGTDGSQITEVFFPKGSDVYISLIASNRSEDIWGPDAKEWRPERWLQPLPSTVAEARIPGVYANLMTFMAGSRSCIGFQFALLEMKTVLALLIESFEFSPTGKEILFELSGVSNPVVKGELEKGVRLPLKVKAVEQK
ncbi:cytochrome p450, partial [Moniliophthora roreri]